MRRRRVYVQCEVVVKHRQGQAGKSGARLSKEIVGQSLIRVEQDKGRKLSALIFDRLDGDRGGGSSRR